MMRTLYSHPLTARRNRPLLVGLAVLLAFVTLLGLRQFPVAGSMDAVDAAASVAAGGTDFVQESGVDSSSEPAGADSTLRKLPLSFVPNAGQTDPAVRFQVHSMGGTVFFTPDEVVLTLPAGRSSESPGAIQAGGKLSLVHGQRPTVLRLRYQGANPAPRVTGVEPLPGVVNYIIGDDASKWRTGLPTYAGIVYEDLYPGVDVRYDGKQGALKGSFTLASGADPAIVRWRYEGARDVAVDAEGNLRIYLASAGEGSNLLMEETPVAWQTIAGRRVPVDARYTVAPDGTVGFAVRNYDASQPLTVDPTLVYSTYLGGSGTDRGLDLDVDSAGNVYVTGSTASSNFPTTTGAFDDSLDGSTDGFVTKIDPSQSGASSLIYSTYLGGDGDDTGSGITVDAAGNAFVAGNTDSSDFPVQYTVDDTPAISFVSVVSSTSTNVGATDDSRHGPFNLGFTFDFYGVEYSQVVVSSNGWLKLGADPGTVAFQDYDNECPLPDSSVPNNLIAGIWDDLVPDQSNPVLQEAYGAGSCPYSGYSGACYIAEWRNVGYFNPPAERTTFEIILLDNDEIVVQISDAGQGGDSSTTGIEDADRNLGVTYRCEQNNSISDGTVVRFLPPYQQNFGGGVSDTFLTKLNSSGSGPAYSTYLGGSGLDLGSDVGIDGSGNAYVIGSTSGSFPTTSGAFQETLGGGSIPTDAFVAKLDPSQSGQAQLVYSSYLGGSADDFGNGIAVSSGKAHVVGATDSTDFFTTTNALDIDCGTDGNCNNNRTDGFVTVFNAAGSALDYSTYLGGGNVDRAFGIATDGAGDVYVTGDTASRAGFPTTTEAFQPALCCGRFAILPDAFATKIDPSQSGASSLVYSTYLGGAGNDYGRGVAVDGPGNVYLTGAAGSDTFPTQSPLPGSQTLSGGVDAFAAMLDPAGSQLQFSTYLGGSSDENAITQIVGGDETTTYLGAIAVSGVGEMHLTGSTESSNFPTTSALDSSLGGSADAFVSHIRAFAKVDKRPLTSTLPELGGTATYAVTVTNIINQSLTLNSLTDDLHGNLDGQGDCSVPQTIVAGANYGCTFSSTVAGDAGTIVTDTVTAQVEDGGGAGDQASDNAVVTITDVFPSANLDKVPDPASMPEPGGAVTFAVTVTNTSPETVTLTSLMDNVYGDVTDTGNALIDSTTCAALPMDIAIGGVYACEFTAQVTGEAGFSSDTLTAQIEDNEGNGADVVDTATVSITDVVPTILVAKVGAPTSLPEPGGTVNFTVTVTNTNTSVEPVTLLSLQDDAHGNLDGQGTCSVGQTIPKGDSFECTFSASVTADAGPSSDTVTAQAKDNEGNIVAASDTFTVTITDVTPTIAVEKTVNLTSVPEPGGAVNFTVVVTNNSVEAVTLNSLADDVYGDVADSNNTSIDNTTCSVPALIPAGDAYQCSFDAQVTGEAGDTRSDTVTAEAEDNEGNSDDAADGATVTIFNVDPAIDVHKTAFPTNLLVPGGTVNYTVRIVNTTSETVTLTSLTDDIYGDITATAAISSTTCSVPQTIAGTGVYQCDFSAHVAGSNGDTLTDAVEAAVQDNETPVNTATGSDSATVTLTDQPSEVDPCQAADVNDDGVVDLADLELVVADWRNPSFNPRHDMNGDGQITVADFQFVASQLGETCP